MYHLPFGEDPWRYKWVVVLLYLPRVNLKLIDNMLTGQCPDLSRFDVRCELSFLHNLPSSNEYEASAATLSPQIPGTYIPRGVGIHRPLDPESLDAHQYVPKVKYNGCWAWLLSEFGTAQTPIEPGDQEFVCVAQLHSLKAHTDLIIWLSLSLAVPWASWDRPMEDDYCHVAQCRRINVDYNNILLGPVSLSSSTLLET